MQPETPFPDFLTRLRDDRVPSLSFRQEWGDADLWRDRARAAYRDAVGQAEVVDWRVVADESVDGCQLETLQLGFDHGDHAEAGLLHPADGGNGCAVLLLHDHGGQFGIGWRKCFPLPEARFWQEKYYENRALALTLAHAGFTVLSVDALGWGSRAIAAPEDQQALAANLMQFGLTPAGIVAAEDVAVARWLVGRGFAGNGLFAVGFSFGGYRAWQIAALSDDVDAAVSISWFGRRAGLLREGNQMRRGQSAFFMLHPALVTLLDFPDMAGIAAPKPMFLRCGDADHLFPADTVAEAIGDLGAIYAARGAKEMLDARLFEGGHVCPADLQSEAIAFLTGNRRGAV